MVLGFLHRRLRGKLVQLFRREHTRGFLPIGIDVSLVFLSAFFFALIAPFYLVNPFFSVAIPPVLCAVFLTLAKRQPLAAAPLESSAADARKEPSHKFPYQLVIGFFVISSCFGFVQSFVLAQPQGTVELVTTATKLAAVVVFAVIVFNTDDTGYPILARAISTICAVALVFLLLAGPGSMLAAGIILTGYSLLEASYYLLSVDCASSERMNPVRVFGAFSIIDSLGYLFGKSLGNAGPPYDGVILALFATAVVIVGIWLFTEKGINDFLWNYCHAPANEIAAQDEGTNPTVLPAEENPKKQPAPSFTDKMQVLANTCGLSPRETEILAMYITGRSATFIADSTFVSPNTVRTHIKHIYAKTNVHSRQELITKIDEQTL